MSTLTLTPPITHKIEQIVRGWGKSAEQVIEDAINEHLNKLNSNKLDAETAAFERIDTLACRNILGSRNTI